MGKTKEEEFELVKQEFLKEMESVMENDTKFDDWVEYMNINFYIDHDLILVRRSYIKKVLDKYMAEEIE